MYLFVINIIFLNICLYVLTDTLASIIWLRFVWDRNHTLFYQNIFLMLGLMSKWFNCFCNFVFSKIYQKSLSLILIFDSSWQKSGNRVLFNYLNWPKYCGMLRFWKSKIKEFVGIFFCSAEHIVCITGTCTVRLQYYISYERTVENMLAACFI